MAVGNSSKSLFSGHQVEVRAPATVTAYLLATEQAREIEPSSPVAPAGWALRKVAVGQTLQSVGHPEFFAGTLSLEFGMVRYRGISTEFSNKRLVFKRLPRSRIRPHALSEEAGGGR